MIVMLLDPKLNHRNAYSQFSTTADRSLVPKKAEEGQPTRIHQARLHLLLLYPSAFFSQLLHHGPDFYCNLHILLYRMYWLHCRFSLQVPGIGRHIVEVHRTFDTSLGER
jgi:hypothetical protein